MKQFFIRVQPGAERGPRARRRLGGKATSGRFREPARRWRTQEIHFERLAFFVTPMTDGIGEAFSDALRRSPYFPMQ
ncbi:MAG: hypothetical protein QF473_26945 [Planctomycetota bacterium]|nr:hypothetical protein [Planctomycetota bacterium]